MFEPRFTSQKSMRMAMIADTFTYDCFAPECDTILLTPENWQDVLQSGDIDMMFIESVWTGKDNSWREHFRTEKKIETLIQIADFARTHFIPTIFWNKEDPFHFSEFIKFAAHCDYVFTSDMGCIVKYKQILKHNGVYWLPFAAQPQLHNPTEEYERVDGFCFPGAYYARYPWRAAFLDKIIASKKDKAFAIYARKGENGEILYPEKYRPYIQGSLPYNEIAKAYKGYKYGINLNSMFYSCTMFARRVFELLACATVCVGNYSRGVKTLFGDLVIATNSSHILSEKIVELESSDEYSLLKQDGVSLVFSEHLYEHRLAYIVSKVFGLPFTNNDSQKLRNTYGICYSLAELYHYAENMKANVGNIKYQYEYNLSDLYDVSDFERQSGIVYSFSEGICIASDLPKKQPVWVRAKKYYRLSDFTDTLSLNLFAEAEFTGKPNIQIEFYDSEKNRITWTNFNYNEDTEIQIPAYSVYFIFIFRLEWVSSVKIKRLNSYCRSTNLPGLVPLSETLMVVEYDCMGTAEFKAIIQKAQSLAAELLIVPNPDNLAPYEEIDGVQITRGNYDAIHEYANTNVIKTIHLYKPSERVKSLAVTLENIEVIL